MRIALLTNGLGFGGAERIVEALAEDLRSAGDEVEVFATTRGGPIADALREGGHPVHVLGLRSALDVRLLVRLREHLHRFRPDLIHSHLAVSDIASAFSGREAVRLSTVHNPGLEIRGAKRWLWRRALPRLDAVAAVSAAAARQLPLPARIMRPSLVDLEAPRLSRNEARARLGLDPSRPLILAVGRRTPVKGLDVLDRAVPHLQTPKVQVAVIGDGEDRSPVHLRLLGPHPDAARLIAAADILALPSRSEGFPQVPLHAMAAEVPVVATAVGGTPEVVVDGVTGRLVPPEAPEALARALDELLQSPERARSFGQAGLQRLRQEGLTRSGMVDAYRNLYRELVRRPR